MRNTKQSNLVLDIVNNSCNHPTAYDVYLECIKNIPNISLTTVYRNLNKLVDKRLIQRFELKDNIIRYDKDMCHDHFVCIKCNKVIDLDRSDITYDEMINGNKVLNVKVFYDGICYDCLNLERKSENNGIKRK